MPLPNQGYAALALAGLLTVDSRATNVNCRVWAVGNDTLVLDVASRATKPQQTWRGRRIYTAEELLGMDESPFGPPEPEWGRLWNEPQNP